MSEKVYLIASGYEWICPEPDCEHQNRIGWIPVVGTAVGNVTCEECKRVFDIESYDHAFHNN